MQRSAKPGGSTLTEHLPAATSGANEVPHRAQMETAFGADFSSVQAHTGQRDAMASIGATAAAQGDSIAFADASPEPWLVAHELTHVVQHQQAGGGAVAKKGTIASVDNAAEREADSVADRVASGQPAGAISAAPEADIHRFAPDGHRASTVAGLKGAFSAEEIGDIYASNWERDFSQGNPDLASASIAWTAVKNHAVKNNGDPGPQAATFQAAVWKVVNGNLTSAMDESLGGYQYFEHMDHPTANFSSPDKAADKRWEKQANGMAGYILDSRAFIKDQMVAAIDVYRELHSMSAVGGSIDNWNGVAKPEHYTNTKVATDGKVVTTQLPKGFEGSNVASRDPIREEATADAAKAGAKSDPGHAEKQWQLVAQNLGRAMHPFQDFWSHSNWLELARAAKKKIKGGGTVTAGAAANKQLKTGTFEMASKAEALGEKLLAFSTGLQKDFPLLLKVYGRTAASSKIDSPEAKKNVSTPFGGNSVYAVTDNEKAYNPLKNDSYSTAGEISDVPDAVNNVEELVLSGKYKMEDFLCNQNWLKAVGEKGKLLIKQGEDNADGNAHAKLAKDQEGEGKDFADAIGLSKQADKLVFAPLRALMDEKDAAKALAGTQAQLSLIDEMIQAPSPSHPLWSFVPED